MSTITSSVPLFSTAFYMVSLLMCTFPLHKIGGAGAKGFPFIGPLSSVPSSPSWLNFVTIVFNAICPHMLSQQHTHPNPLSPMWLRTHINGQPHQEESAASFHNNTTMHSKWKFRRHPPSPTAHPPAAFVAVDAAAASATAAGRLRLLCAGPGHRAASPRPGARGTAVPGSGRRRTPCSGGGRARGGRAALYDVKSIGGL